MDAAQVIAKTMAAAKRPLTDDQQILLAGALAVCMEKQQAEIVKLRAALQWVAVVNAMDYEYQNVARKALEA